MRKKFALIGYPAKHSKSPEIFNFLSKKFELTFDYEILEIKPEEFLEKIPELQKYDGLNITSPFKEKILKFCDEFSEEVEILNAANVLTVKKEGKVKIKSYNTDVNGFMESIFPPIEGKTALILGSSGASRAVALGLLRLGVKQIYIKARNIASLNDFRISTGHITGYEGQKSELIVQATTIGLNKDLEGLSQREKEFFNVDYSSAEICYDLNYSPAVTPFMEISQKRMPKGGTVMNGKNMLIMQAIGTFEIWFDRKFSKNQKQDLLREISKEIKNL